MQVATKIMKQMIEQFAACDLFGRVNYEYYARVTGRVLRVQDEWICSFRYPPPPRGKTAQQHYASVAQEESHSTPALLTTGGPNVGNSAVSLGIIPEHSLLESCARLSVSLEGPGIFNVPKGSCSSSSHSSSSTTRSGSQHHMTLDELRAVNRYAESTKSLSYLPQVHERQAARMRTRSEWFLGARGSSLELCHDGTGSLIHPQIVTSTPIPGTVGHHHHPHGIIGTYASIDNLNDIVVVVDVNQDQPNQYHHNHNHNHDHRQYNHYHEHAHSHAASSPSPDLLHPSSSHRLPRRNNELPGSPPRATNSSENIASKGDRRSRSHPYERRPSPNDVHSRSSAVERRQKARSRASGKPTEKDTIEYCCEEDNTPVLEVYDDGGDDDDILALHDQVDGDEHDFAITLSHHFDMRAENRRRRRRRALLRRGSYDEIVSSAAFPSANDCCRASTGTAAAAAATVASTVAVASGSLAAASPTERPSSAPASSFTKTAKKIGNVGLSASAESVHQSSSAKRPSRRGGSRHGHLHRSSSRRNKENGSSRSNSFRNKANSGGAPGGGKVGANSNTQVSTAVISSSPVGNDGRGLAGGTSPGAAGIGPGTGSVVGSGRVRKQRAVSFEQTSTTTAGTMTTSSSLSATGPAVTGAGGVVLPGAPMHHPPGAVGVGPRAPGAVVWHEYASKSLDEKKLLSKQNNVVGGGGTAPDGSRADGIDVPAHGRRSIVSVCVNDRQLPDSDDDWPMVDQSRPTPPHHHALHHQYHHHHHGHHGSSAGTGANAPTGAGTTAAGGGSTSSLHHFKPPRI
uniref:Uncharacterized protein n=1 Tax=Anopheles atroparvus TaxID=41427 RepID=A0A182IR34_ANOAO